ncbi:MAG: hypothetical protein K1X74_16240 [Pirellulales bacterium]|nr:hypothetical protein [Pirellulales bacterium]
MRFSVGEIVVTPRAQEVLDRAGVEASVLLARHQAGDWGSVSPEQRRLNEMSLQQRLHLVSTYETPLGDMVTVFTKADRSYTLVHLAPPQPAAASHRHAPQRVVLH